MLWRRMRLLLYAISGMLLGWGLALFALFGAAFLHFQWLIAPLSWVASGLAYTGGQSLVAAHSLDMMTRKVAGIFGLLALFLYLLLSSMASTSVFDAIEDCIMHIGYFVCALLGLALYFLIEKLFVLYAKRRAMLPWDDFLKER